MKPLEADVIILGGGLVGLTLALALNRHGVSSHVVDTANLEATIAPTFDGRVSAISSSSMRMLDVIGIGERVRPVACAISEICVTEGLMDAVVHFDARKGGAGDPLGFMVENRLLRQALLEEAGKAQLLNLHAPARAIRQERDEWRAEVELDNGQILRAPLLIVAEGRNSPTREAVGIKVARWRYNHGAVVTVVDHEKGHGGTAYEIFYTDGPFAILPMVAPDGRDTRSAIVWTMEEKLAPAAARLPERAMVAEIEKRMGGFLGALKLAAPAWTYPLGFHHADRIIVDRLALVGDAAHGIHPIAGQGLNLGFRDVAALAEVLVEASRLGLDLGDPQVLLRYQRWRGFDTMMVAGVTDSLTWLFGMPGRTMRRVRSFGLGMVERITPIKHRFMAEARGETGDLPRMLRGDQI